MDRAIGLETALHLELRHEWANLGDVRLHYVTGGQGPAVVFLHGWPQTWYMWRDVIPGLAKNYRVVAVDLRGLGDSSKPVTGYDTTTVVVVTNTKKLTDVTPVTAGPIGRGDTAITVTL